MTRRLRRRIRKKIYSGIGFVFFIWLLMIIGYFLSRIMSIGGSHANSSWPYHLTNGICTIVIGFSLAMIIFRSIKDFEMKFSASKQRAEKRIRPPKLEIFLFFIQKKERDDILGDLEQDFFMLLESREIWFAKTAYVFSILGFFWRRVPAFSKYLGLAIVKLLAIK